MKLQATFTFQNQEYTTQFDTDTHKDKCEDWSTCVEYYVAISDYTFCISIPRVDAEDNTSPITISQGGFVDYYINNTTKESCDLLSNGNPLDVQLSKL